MSKHLLYGSFLDPNVEVVSRETFNAGYSAVTASLFEQSGEAFDSYNRHLQQNIGDYDRLIRVGLPWDHLSEAGKLLMKKALDEGVTIEIR